MLLPERKTVTIQSLLGEYLALLSQQYGIWVILLNMNGPFTGLNAVAWQWPHNTPRSHCNIQNNIRRSSLGTLPLKSTKWGVGRWGGGGGGLEAVPETLKELSLCEMQVLGTSGSDFGDNGQIIQRFVRFSERGGGGTIAVPFQSTH